MKNHTITIFITLFLLFSTTFSIAQNKVQAKLQDKKAFETAPDPAIQQWLDKLVAYDPAWPVKKQTTYRALIRAFELKEGALIVRLRSHSKKLKTLEQLVNNPNISKKEKKRLQKNLVKTRTESVAVNEKIVNDFKISYYFSNVYFMYDTSTHHLRKGLKKGYFLDDNLVINPHITLKENLYFTCDYKNVSSYRSMMGMVIQDKNSNQLAHPFPGTAAAPASPANYFIDSLLGKKTYLKVISKHIRLLNRRLDQFMAKGLERFSKTGLGGGGSEGATQK